MLRVTPLGAGQHVGGKLSSWEEGKYWRNKLNHVESCWIWFYHVQPSRDFMLRQRSKLYFARNRWPIAQMRLQAKYQLSYTLLLADCTTILASSFPMLVAVAFWNQEASNGHIKSWLNMVHMVQWENHLRLNRNSLKPAEARWTNLIHLDLSLMLSFANRSHTVRRGCRVLLDCGVAVAVLPGSVSARQILSDLVRSRHFALSPVPLRSLCLCLSLNKARRSSISRAWENWCLVEFSCSAKRC